MSEISNVHMKEFTIKLTRLSRDEIELHTKRSFEEAQKIADLKIDVKPKIFIRKDIHTDVMDIKKTQDTESTSNTGDEIMPDINAPQNILNDGINNEEINETQDTESTSNTGDEIMPDINAPQNILNDGINNEEINDTQEEDNMYSGFDDFMPSTIYQQYDQNYMDTTEGRENIDNPSISYIPNMMMIKQEIQDDSYGTYMPQVAGSSQIMIKQEVVDESYNYNMYGEYIMPNISNQPDQNFGMQGIIPETSNPNVIIKQEVFDEGNIEVYTDVLRPSADQEYEDGSPW